MELKHYFAIVWGRKWVILTTVIATLAIVIIGTLLATPQYLATTKIRVATAAGAVTSSDYMYADRLLNTYTSIATSGPILGELSSRLGRTTPPAIKAEILPNTEIIQISVEDSDPVMAANAANILAEILIAQSQELYSGGGKSPQEILGEQLAQIEAELNLARKEYESLITESPGDSERISALSQAIELKQETYASLLTQYEQARVKEAIRANTMSVVEPAKIPESPSKPRKAINIALGFLVGLAGGIGLVFLFENLDATLYTSDQIENITNSSPLGNIPTTKDLKNSSLFNGNSPFGESFRRLRNQILQSHPSFPPHTLLVTSAEQGEGKSVIAANLALAFAQSGRTVVLLDCDLRRPSQHRIFNMQQKMGLSTVLKEKAGSEDAVRASWIPDLNILVSGPQPDNPAELLASDQMCVLLEELKTRYDFILLDSPALMAVSDAALLAPHVDGVILIVSRGRSKERAVRSACRQLSDINANSIGVVINNADQPTNYYYYSQRKKKK